MMLCMCVLEAQDIPVSLGVTGGKIGLVSVCLKEYLDIDLIWFIRVMGVDYNCLLKLNKSTYGKLILNVTYIHNILQGRSAVNGLMPIIGL